MVRVASINIPDHKHTDVALTAIFGIGRNTARKICKDSGVAPMVKVKDLKSDELEKIRAEVVKYSIEGDLRREINLNIKRLRDLGAYRGIRHRRGLPTHGQRTRTNARTRKGPRKIIKK